MSCRCWSISHSDNANLKLQRHAGEWVIRINHDVPVILVDLSNHHILDTTLIVTVREKTHSRLDLINTAKRFNGYPLLQRLVSLPVCLLRRQDHVQTLACNPALERSLKGRQQPPTPMLILQRLIAPHRRPNVTDRTVSTQGVINGHVFPDANPLRRTEVRRSQFMIMIMIMIMIMLVTVRRDIAYHSSFSILRRTTCVSRVKMPVGPQ